MPTRPELISNDPNHSGNGQMNPRFSLLWGEMDIEFNPKDEMNHSEFHQQVHQCKWHG